MLSTFLATLDPMLMLFLCIAVGFLARKTKILPENAGKVMAKLETWIFCPALGFVTMATRFTVTELVENAQNLLLSCLIAALAMGLAIFLARFFVKDKRAYERGVYKYALTFGNGGYVGDPLVLALFGVAGLGFYKVYYLPLNIIIYTWGISVLVPHGEEKESVFKKLLNAPTVGLLAGMLVGITGLGAHMPVFLTNTLDSLKSCMGPVAMLLCGFTVAGYPMKQMLSQKKVYVASLLRLIVLPSVLVAALFGIKTLANALFGLSIGNNVLFLAFFAFGTPLGMNTIVYPEAFGGDPKTGASMALISHTLCVITIPLMYALLTAIFGKPVFL